VEQCTPKSCSPSTTNHSRKQYHGEQYFAFKSHWQLGPTAAVADDDPLDAHLSYLAATPFHPDAGTVGLGRERRTLFRCGICQRAQALEPPALAIPELRRGQPWRNAPSQCPACDTQPLSPCYARRYKKRACTHSTSVNARGCLNPFVSFLCILDIDVRRFGDEGNVTETMAKGCRVRGTLSYLISSSIAPIVPLPYPSGSSGGTGFAKSRIECRIPLRGVRACMRLRHR
jgi:hypothetical protein